MRSGFFFVSLFDGHETLWCVPFETFGEMGGDVTNRQGIDSLSQQVCCALLCLHVQREEARKAAAADNIRMRGPGYARQAEAGAAEATEAERRRVEAAGAPVSEPMQVCSRRRDVWHTFRRDLVSTSASIVDVYSTLGCSI